MAVNVICGDSRQVLSGMPAGLFDCCVTSPPYLGLRDYEVPGQIGLDGLQAYIADLVSVFQEVWRVLKPAGTLWLNLGDTYSGYYGNRKRADHEAPSNKPGYWDNMRRSDVGQHGLKAKDLIGVPWRVAFALQGQVVVSRQEVIALASGLATAQEAGDWQAVGDVRDKLLALAMVDGLLESGWSAWWLRSEIIWYKPNGRTESVGDRPTRATETIFMLSKQPRYYYDQDAIREPQKAESIARAKRGPWKGRAGRTEAFHGNPPKGLTAQNTRDTSKGSNKRNVWSIAVAGAHKGSRGHFARYPEALIEPCLLAGCPPGGTVLDPFGGTGTTGAVAKRLGRSAVLVDAGLDFCRDALDRTAVVQGQIC